jgi:hypothetical protein
MSSRIESVLWTTGATAGVLVRAFDSKRLLHQAGMLVNHAAVVSALTSPALATPPPIVISRKRGAKWTL